MAKEKNSKKDNDYSKVASELKERIKELEAGWQRTQADFINFRKKAEEEKARIRTDAKADLIYEILPVLDNFRLAAKHIPENLKGDNWTKGIIQIEKQLEAILKAVGVEEIDAVGKEFDPNIHEAVEEVESDDEPGTVVEEVLKGFRLGDKIVRPAKVKVAK